MICLEGILMIYRKDRYGNEISQLGYGCMRFSRTGSSLDFEKAEKFVSDLERIVNKYAGEKEAPEDEGDENGEESNENGEEGESGEKEEEIPDNR